MDGFVHTIFRRPGVNKLDIDLARRRRCSAAYRPYRPGEMMPSGSSANFRRLAVALDEL